MSNAILFAAIGTDEDQLVSYVESIGLRLVPGQPGPRTLKRIRGGYLSPIPESELQIWRNPRLNHPAKYSDALDPLLPFNFGEALPNHFRPGRITQNIDNALLAGETKLYFGRLSRWIRKNWPKPEGMHTYCGPEAHALIRSKGLIVTDLIPGVMITYVPIDRPYRLERD